MSATPVDPFQLGTFSRADGHRFPGMVVSGRVLPLRSAIEAVSGSQVSSLTTGTMLDFLRSWDEGLPVLMAAARQLQDGSALLAEAEPIEKLGVHPPVDLPRQIFCSGANYKQHVVQLIMAEAPDETRDMSDAERYAFAVRRMDERAANGTPFCFVKAQSAVAGPFDDILLAPEVEKPDWELELGVVIGRRARRVSLDKALDYVAGYTIVNDITSRERLVRRAGDMRNLGMDWTAGKCSPTYLPMGPFLTPACFIEDPQALQVTLRLNGEVMQDESTADMIFGVARLIEYLSNIVLLQPGDVICTGSPAGNGVHYRRFLKPGDVVEGSITGLGTQRNTCIAETP